MADLITDYQALKKTLGLPKMQSGSYRREEARKFESSRKALEHLRDSGPKCGWLLFQSWQGGFVDGLPEIENQWGNLLAAEAVFDGGECATLEYRSETGWHFIRLKHDDQGDGLWDRVEYLIRQPGGGKLVYRRYWGMNATHGAVQVGVVLEAVETKARGA